MKNPNDPIGMETATFLIVTRSLTQLRAPCHYEIQLNTRVSSSFSFQYECAILTQEFNPLNAELNPICYLLALLGAHHFLHISRIRVKSLTLRLLMSYIYIYIYVCV